MPNLIRYQTTGPLTPGNPLYVTRAADTELLEQLRSGEFCYVLSARQMGKSSLLSHTVAKLRNEGVFVATANLQAAGDVKSEAEWYEGIVDQLVTTAAQNEGFTLPFEWGEWWDKQRGPLGQRFVNFIREGFLSNNECRWIITVDEIDVTISLPFTDSFFGAIRLCYDNRPGQSEFRRLSVALFGVATPTELIKDRSRTPFNIGKGIELQGFTLAEATKLAEGLKQEDSIKEAAIERIIYWTGGQPHLTQEICQKLHREWVSNNNSPSPKTVIESVDKHVAELFFSGNVFKQPHFAYIAEQRIGRYRDKAGILRVLDLCRNEFGCDPNDFGNKVAELKISGLAVVSEDGRFRISNQIYRRVFDENWISEQWPSNNCQFAGYIFTAFLAILISAWFYWFSPQMEKRAAEETELFAAVRNIVFSEGDIPNREKSLLEKYSDEKISESIAGARRHLAEVGVSKTQYRILENYARNPQIKQKLWEDYWLNQANTLNDLVTQLVVAPTPPNDLLTQVEAVSKRLNQADLQGSKTASSIEEIAGIATMKLVKTLWKPINQGTSKSTSNIDISNKFDKWEALAKATDSIAPLLNDHQVEEAFNLVIYGPPGQQLKIIRADELASKQFNTFLKDKRTSITMERNDAQNSALYRLFRSSNAYSLAEITIKASIETDSGIGFLTYLPAALKTIGDALPNKESSKIAILLIDTMALTADFVQLNDLSLALDALQENLSSDGAAERASLLVEAMKDADHPSQVMFMGAMLEALGENLPSEAAIKGAYLLLKTLEKTSDSDSLTNLGIILSRLGEYLPREEVVRVAEALVIAMEATSDPFSLRILGIGLSEFVEQLPSDEAEKGAKLLIANMRKTTDPYDLAMLGNALSSLGEYLPSEETARGARIIVEAIEDASDPFDLDGLVEQLSEFGPHLPIETIVEFARSLIAVMKTTTSSDRLTSIADGLSSLAPYLPSEDIAIGADLLLTAVKNASNISDIRLLGNSLSNLATHLPNDEAEEFAHILIIEMENTSRSDQLAGMGEALSSLGAYLSSEDAAKGIRLLIAAIENSNSPNIIDELGNALSSLKEHLSSNEVTEVTRFLVAALKEASELPRKIALSITLSNFGEHISNNEAAEGAAILITAMEETKSIYDRISLGTALVKLCEQLQFPIHLSQFAFSSILVTVEFEVEESSIERNFIKFCLSLNPQHLAEILKWPNLKSKAQQIVLSELEKQLSEKTGRIISFEGRLSSFTEQAESLGIKTQNASAVIPTAEAALTELEQLHSGTAPNTTFEIP